jgi:hypothetical protein
VRWAKLFKHKGHEGHNVLTRPPKRTYAPIPPEVERIGKAVLDAAFKVHTVLGPGLLESVYETALAHVIRKVGLLVETQVVLPIMFEGVQLESGLRLDMRSGIRLGYLINFNVTHLKDGIKRMVV